jgi:hypothetical protein
MNRLWLAFTSFFLLIFTACTTASESVRLPVADPSTSVSDMIWLETETAGVELGLWKPAGWAADTRSGLALVEQVSEVGDHPAQAMEGVVVHFFFPDLGNFDLSAGSPNLAMDIMTQAAVLPEVRESAVAISAPAAFEWRDHDAAYYLLTGQSDTRTLVIGIFLPEKDKLLAINVSMPAHEAGQIREMLPALFADFMIDGIELGGADLNRLPQPLPFPLADEPA